MKCKVCGRTEDELVEEFGNQTEVREHQGMKKCSKCIREYEVETGDGSESADDNEDLDWKEEVLA